MPGQAPATDEPVERPHYPQHSFASPSSPGLDPNAIKPHVCMTNVVQRGSYIHCHTGNHGMRLAADEVLEKDSSGQFVINKIVIRDRDGKPVTA